MNDLSWIDKEGIRAEQGFRLRGARVDYIDQDAIDKDFPELRQDAQRLKIAYSQYLESWLLQAAAVMSTSQCGANAVNGELMTEGDPVRMLRPPGR
jgi:hypothetical protein